MAVKNHAICYKIRVLSLVELSHHSKCALKKENMWKHMKMGLLNYWLLKNDLGPCNCCFFRRSLFWVAMPGPSEPGGRSSPPRFWQSFNSISRTDWPPHYYLLTFPDFKTFLRPCFKSFFWSMAICEMIFEFTDWLFLKLLANKILTANIFESGPMPTPWKFLDSLPVIPSC